MAQLAGPKAIRIMVQGEGRHVPMALTPPWLHSFEGRADSHQPWADTASERQIWGVSVLVAEALKTSSKT